MKFSILRNRLIESVQDVSKAITSKTTIPILTGIKITASEEGITFTGSDSDISIESFVPKEEDGDEIAVIQQTGGIVLQAKIFGELVKKLPMDIVEIEVVNQFQTIIRSGKSNFNLNGLDAEEYPHLPQITEDKVIRIPADILKNLIRQTVFAVSTAETRPILTGVNWSIKGSRLNCIATDSHRLAQRTAEIETAADAEYNIVIPGKSLNELNKILPDSNEPVGIVITDNQVLFKAKHLLFFSRLLEGNYPDTSRLIPTDGKTEIVVNTKEFLQAIDRASLLAKEGQNANVVKLSSVTDIPGTIEITSNSPEIGKVTDRVNCKSIEGEELKISFSSKYMMDALRALEGTEITIRFTGAMRPFIIRPVHDDTTLQLILPVRTY
ncbi:DNA polymerase III subunit beta [Heyndrickxia coagulans]|uniref:Beta sliding clamp n=1 Tax=Heyndrickxia coagulans DSM 1 = ATCC 7050 TaxID=1121088 RepID=A0A8B4BWU1_HEYCO|nr:DNA polymerase III subunit beta [Heyndrickxia coagulans]AJH79011.1 DNA polymerase III, beta subunit [Heyndrickxia coagulans DSM 1 = ATCC 7050]MCR2846853.1 DNA polymerase III subunit beta [Heyndrickxia coagulans]MDR4224202.1 DNA polymerase III subunit beta [Heyndrickxia coagulans DSM 1 = ATCC 7050]MED4495056.1 DNA polymerase III subunit beta [Heyndrickxia coagulans]MED4536684.1 DNA polymerase III subunit beta [Heyndrickxia coagulans]